MWVWVRLDTYQVDFHRRLGEVRKGLRPAEGLWVCRGADHAELQSLQKGMAPPRVVWHTISTALRGGPHIPPLELRGAAQVFLGSGTNKKDKRNKDGAKCTYFPTVPRPVFPLSSPPQADAPTWPHRPSTHTTSLHTASSAQSRFTLLAKSKREH